MSCSMSEGMSPILTSNPKRSREEDSDSGGSTGRSHCQCVRRKRRGKGEFSGHADKNRHGYHDKDSISKEYMERCLKHLVRKPDDIATADPDGKLCTGIDISKHLPWDIVDWKVNKARYFLSWYDSGPRKKDQTINDAFLYKQSGNPHSGIVQTTYFHCKSRRAPHISKDGPDDPIWPFYQHDQEKKRAKERKNKKGVKKGKTEGSRSRWRMRKSCLSNNDTKEPTGGSLPRYRAEISMIFEDKKGKPDWTPTRQDIVETPPIDQITEAGNVGVSLELETIPDPVLPWEDMVASNLPRGRETLMASNSKETGELDIAAFWQDGTTLTPDSDSLSFEETGELDVATLWQDAATLTPDSDSLNFEETRELDVATQWQDAATLTPDSDSLSFEETGELDVATLWQDAATLTPDSDSLNFEETGELNVATLWQDGPTLTPDSDSPNFEETGELNVATLWHDGPTLTPDSDSLNFEETRELDVATLWQDGTTLTPDFDSLNFKETGGLDVATLLQDGTTLTPDSDSLGFETRELDVATLWQDGTALTSDSDSPLNFETGELNVPTLLQDGTTLTPDSDSPQNFDGLCPGFHQTVDGMCGSERLF